MSNYNFSPGTNQFLERVEKSDKGWIISPKGQIRSLEQHTYSDGLKYNKCPICALSTSPETLAFNADDFKVYNSVGLDYGEARDIMTAADNSIFNLSGNHKDLRAALIKACKLG